MTDQLDEESEDDVLTDVDFLKLSRRVLRDLRRAELHLGPHEARYLVDVYYTAQEQRIRAVAQVRQRAEGEPDAALNFIAKQAALLEGAIKGRLDQYTNGHVMGAFMRGTYGIGPVLSAGLLAHIDIHKAPTVGHIWQFAGIAGDGANPWEKGHKRPYNARLKTLCCHPATMITTRNNVVPITAVKVGDEVLTHKGRFRKVTATHQSDHDGGLIGLRVFGNSAASLYVTDNHPVYTETRLQWAATKGRMKSSFGARDRVLRAGCLPDEQIRIMREQRQSGMRLKDLAELYGCTQSAVSLICNEITRQKPLENERIWMRADGVMPGWLLCSPRLPHGPMRVVTTPQFTGKAKRLPETIVIDDEIARFLGLFMAEGHVSKNYVGFSFHVAEIEYHAFIADVLKRRFGLTFPTPRPNGNSWQAVISSKALATFFADLIGKGAFTKHVPHEIWCGPESVKAAFLRGWFEGDGDLRQCQLTTSSAVGEAHALLNSLGITSTVTPYQNSYKVSVTSTTTFNELVFCGDLVSDRHDATFVRREVNANWGQAKESTLLPYKGTVYNLEVEGDNSYTANGVAVHNCWKIGQSFMKFSNRPECYYGGLYRERKAREIARNEAGELAEQAAQKAPKVSKYTDAYKSYSVGRLPPAHLDARARRWTVKLFLAHMHDEWYRLEFGTEPPYPYPIVHLENHTHLKIPPQGDQPARIEHISKEDIDRRTAQLRRKGLLRKKEQSPVKAKRTKSATKGE